MMVSYWSVNVFSPCFVEVAGLHVCVLWRNTLCGYCRLLGFHGETTGWFQVGHIVLWRKSQIATYQLTSNKLLNVPVPQFPRL